MAIITWGRQTKNSQFSRMVDKPIGRQTKGVQLVLGLVFDHFYDRENSSHVGVYELSKTSKKVQKISSLSRPSLSILI